MGPTLPEPEVLRCYFEESFTPHLPAMCLRWPDAEAAHERLWELPEGVSLLGPPPARFGVSIRRLAEDSYAVRLLWDRSAFQWKALSRAQLLTSALAPLLAALGTEIWYLLDQPLPDARPVPRTAA
jgi:hypothetical protein